MLQIISYLLCVYLVFKGLEIFQAHITSGEDDRSASGKIGYGALIAAVALALLFAFWITYHVKQVERHGEDRRREIESLFR